jgi:hypothetical protein
LILPAQFNTFKLQVWDRNAINANEVICEANLNLKSFFTKTIKKKSVREILPKQWVSMTHPNASGVQGEVEISFELLVKEEAIRNPGLIILVRVISNIFTAGFGRSDPNLNPTLPEPKRPATSIAPWDVKNQTKLAVANVTVLIRDRERYWRSLRFYWRFYWRFYCNCSATMLHSC